MSSYEALLIVVCEHTNKENFVCFHLSVFSFPHHCCQPQGHLGCCHSPQVCQKLPLTIDGVSHAGQQITPTTETNIYINTRCT